MRQNSRFGFIIYGTINDGLGSRLVAARKLDVTCCDYDDRILGKLWDSNDIT